MKAVRILLVLGLFALLFACRAEYAAYTDGESVLISELAEDGFKPIESLTLGIGETLYFDVRGSGQVSFYTSDAYVARITGSGLINPVSKGKCRLRAYYSKTDYIELPLVVKSAPKYVEFANQSVEVVIQNDMLLQFRVNEGAAGMVWLYSSDEEIASVDPDGTLHALGAGECEILAEAYNGAKGSCKVKVVYPPPALIVAPDALVCYESENTLAGCELSGGYNETLSYASSDERVATVDAGGVVSGLTPGRATIIAQASGGTRREIPVTVYPGALSIRSEAESYALYEGGCLEIKALCEGGSGNYSLESSEPALMSVEGSRVYAHAPGTFTVALSTPNGKTAACSVSVIPRPEELKLHVPFVHLAEGETCDATYAPAAGAYLPARFSSSDADVCFITPSGRISALSRGEATISLDIGGLHFEQELTVSQLADGISFEPQYMRTSIGSLVQPELIYTNGGGRAEYASSDAQVAETGSEGIFARRAGSAVISARLSNGALAQMQLDVLDAPEYLISAQPIIELCENDRYAPEIYPQPGAHAELSFSSTDETVFRAEGGSILATGTGEATLVAAAQNGVSLELPVRVSAAPAALTLNLTRLSHGGAFTHYIGLNAGERFLISCSPCKSVEYLSLSPEIADVANDGTLSALTPGTAKVLITAACGVRAVVMVEVI